MKINSTYLLQSGAHNDNEEEEGKVRSANCPRERLKFQIFLMIVALLCLDVDDASQRMHNELTLCISIVTNVFVILIDGQEHRISKTTQQSA